MLAAAVLTFVALLSFLEGRNLAARKMHRELAAHLVLLLAGLSLLVPQLLGARIPSPMRAIEVIFGPLCRFLE